MDYTGEVFTCILENCQIPQREFLFLHNKNFEEQTSSLANQFPQEIGGMLFIICSLDEVTLSCEVTLLCSVEFVVGKQLLKVGAQIIISTTENQDIIDAVRCFIANTKPV